MDTELKCNHLSCRKLLSDRAVVTTCSHIFCVDCANNLFTAAQLCPACETQLTEPDDVVVCSLHPSNDYKTSVLSGLNPSIVLEICARAISFWQYQVHQEQAFQQAVLKNLHERNSQLQKQVENVIREANSEIRIMRSKMAGLEKDLELERRKGRELQDAGRERDKEYQKLKGQYDKLKRNTILNPNAVGSDPSYGLLSVPQIGDRARQFGQSMAHDSFGSNLKQGDASGMPISAVVGNMEATGIQRTPLRTVGGSLECLPSSQRLQRHTDQQRPTTHAQQHKISAQSISDNSAGEVENVLFNNYHRHGLPTRSNKQVFAAASQRTSHNQGERMYRPAHSGWR